MAQCRGCGETFDWGFCDGKWVPLEPVESHDDLDRTYIDEDGELRADHRDRHPHGRSVNVTRLDAKVRADDVAQEAPFHRRVAEAARHVAGKG